jgi:F-type H+-transporting ATPase subunit a
MAAVVPYSFVVLVALALVAYLGTKRSQRIPSTLQNLLELVVDSLTGLTTSILGPSGAKLTPLVGTFFLYILGQNLLGAVPGMKSPTANLNTTVSLALVAIVVVHILAIQVHGVGGWLKHFAGEPAFLAPLMFPLHVIGELARPLSLSLRLFGNIFGEDSVVAILGAMSPFLFKLAGGYGLAVPLQLPMLLFAMFGGLIQALVFTMLFCIYISVTVGDLDGHSHAH